MVSDRRYGRYWNLILALGWLILVGASEPPKSNNEGITAQAGQQIQQAANSISTAITNAAKSAEKDWGCQDRSDKRDSDLCAQWKAADASQSAADYSFWALLVSSIGTGLLVWTLWETREASRKELRAYIKIIAPDQAVSLVVGEPIKILMHAVNYGHTPALNASFKHSCGIAGTDWQWGDEHESTRNKEVAVTLHRDAPLTCEIFSQFDLSRDHLEAIKSGRETIYARGIYFYDDVFGKPHITQVSLEIRDIEIATNRVKVAPTGNIST